MECVWFSTIYIWQGNKPQNHFVKTETDKPVATVMKYAQILRCNYTLWILNISNSPDLTWFLKSEGTNYADTLHGNRKNVPPLVETIKMKRRGHFGPHSGDAAILVWHIKETVQSSPHTTQMKCINKQGPEHSQVSFSLWPQHLYGMCWSTRSDDATGGMVEKVWNCMWNCSTDYSVLTLITMVIYKTMSTNKAPEYLTQAPANQGTSRKTLTKCASSCVWSSIHWPTS